MRLILVVSLILLSGCSVGPKYVAPDIVLPGSWKNGQHQECPQEAVYLDYWWQVFEDCQLDQLEKWAITNNRNLFMAFQRVEEARAMTGIAAADLYPQISLNPQFTNTNLLIKNYNVQTSSIAGVPIRRVFRAHQLLFFLPMNLSYEVDLWGKIRDQVAAAKYSWIASKEDYDAVLLTLTANLATAYFQLRLADEQIAILQKVLKTREEAFAINQDRYEGEVTFYADVSLAGAEEERVRQQLEETVRQRKVLENQIATLIGIPASCFCLEPMPLDGLPPCIPEGIPSEVLLRRPDIAKAEADTRSRHALVKRAVSLFYPSLTLTATLGFESPVLKDFLSWFSRYSMLGTNLHQVIFDGGRLCSNLKLEIARFREASGAYQNQVLLAFQEVENALANLASYAEEYEALEKATEWATTSNTLYKDRYISGLTYYIDVINTERDLLNYQLSLASVQGLRFISTVQLIQALGGSWCCPQNPVCLE